MSSPDKLTALRTKIDIYEEELQQVGTVFDLLGKTKLDKGETEVVAGVLLAGLAKGFDLTTKLLQTYREYVKELEKLKPRN